MGNKILKIFPASNHSFTGIVNHTAHDLRPGKNSGPLDGEVVSQVNHLEVFLNVTHHPQGLVIHHWIQESVERG
jgi:hypothetical protein